MIIHASMRTDIPAFYSRWFLRRIREGFVCVRNPYNPSSVTRYRLSPDVVDLLAFCTKNPAPLLSHLDKLSPYRQHWSITITPYGKNIEPAVPAPDAVIFSFRELSSAIGAAHTAWRYDPIILTPYWTIERHIAAFSQMAAALEGVTETVMASFLDLYPKVQRNFPEGRYISPAERIQLGKELIRIARRHGMRFIACAEGNSLARCGADCSGCFSKARLESIIGTPLSIPMGARVRKECPCIMGHDIGAYDSCPHFCRYCYANSTPAAVRRNLPRHDPRSPFLLGPAHPGDVIHEAKQKSWIQPQMNLF